MKPHLKLAAAHQQWSRRCSWSLQYSLGAIGCQAHKIFGTDSTDKQEHHLRLLSAFDHIIFAAGPPRRVISG